ncbi:hypothetical protein P8S54_06320 [Thiomicrospira sp. R3]|uniref:hypothetical protein n=1 Tax=Thiomicrospira sp. R3 TaxID=3035472 RepID=UPI00259AFC96|nr:hypothetical protein [Thiomicrospira sp. R3]WFE67846.1 hypothetical protein P8S54_06320 [Thiomicrospira sp. R3]
MTNQTLQTHLWRPAILPHLPYQKWQAPAQDTAFFCDLHADAQAFLRSLKQAGLITHDLPHQPLRLTLKGLKTRIIIGGDCFDKGPSTLALLRLINNLLTLKPDTILLAGNHDVRFLAGLLALKKTHDPLQSHFFGRMGKKAIMLFAEIYQEKGEHPNPQHQAHFVDEQWMKSFKKSAKKHLTKKYIKTEISQLLVKQHSMKKAWLKRFDNTQQLNHAISWAHELFLKPDGEFYNFFKSLKLVHTEGSFLFSHAGIDDQLANLIHQGQLEKINLIFQQKLHQSQLFDLYYGALGNAFRTKYRNYDWPFTAKGAQHLKAKHIFALVNGHRHHLNGQQLLVKNGLLNFECDTQLNCHCRSKEGMQIPGWSVTIFHQDGSVSARSSDHSHLNVFQPYNWIDYHGQNNTYLRA